jgi:hypothetical protein
MLAAEDNLQVLLSIPGWQSLLFFLLPSARDATAVEARPLELAVCSVFQQALLYKMRGDKRGHRLLPETLAVLMTFAQRVR